MTEALGLVLFYVAAALLAALGALTYRWRGMPAELFPAPVHRREVRRGMFLLCLASCCALSGAGPWSLAAVVLAAYGVVMGHGKYIDVWKPEREVDDEPTRKLVAWVLYSSDGRVGPPQRLLGLALTGAALTAPLALLPGVSIFYAAAGLLKPLSYALPWRRVGVEPTVGGEYAWGGAACLLACLL